jgi:CcmD family protein
VKGDLSFLFWAYTIIWIFIAGYLGILMARQRTLRRHIDEIKSKLAERK